MLPTMTIIVVFDLYSCQGGLSNTSYLIFDHPFFYISKVHDPSLCFWSPASCTKEILIQEIPADLREQYLVALTEAQGAFQHHFSDSVDVQATCSDSSNVQAISTPRISKRSFSSISQTEIVIEHPSTEIIGDVVDARTANESDTDNVFKKRIKKREAMSWDDYFMSVSFLSAMRSKDPSTQVGACIVNEDKRIVGIGYNGFPRGCR